MLFESRAKTLLHIHTDFLKVTGRRFHAPSDPHGAYNALRRRFSDGDTCNLDRFDIVI